ncbi:uncharacterized protein NMK_1198 [Novimethylophilus kurashikiensis]|uniref:Uncharacterized protein n=1 Tax=Novimethylophilus kurashikiensis TaxID=1825523 RepID=A0A2R5F5U6_9PROT|nr:hypothetical protein [Novimethylophilus kurashikiensis]GBG13647.1 uncharacterized protein NMK_1198 [Novimethylophilus kurashikiensis]
MASINVKQIDDTTFDVAVEDRTSTHHTVTVPLEYAASVAPGVPLGRLVRTSFEFLLERESNSSILRKFDLPVIARYFPEYRTEIRKMLDRDEAR